MGGAGSSLTSRLCEVVNGRKSTSEDVVQILNSALCGGLLEANFVRRRIKPVDVLIIPENVPYGFADIADHRVLPASLRSRVKAA